MKDYPYGYCGMPCALCTRYRTDGKSRCPGCSHDGYYTDVCKIHHCCRDKNIVSCAVCDEFSCERLGKMGDFRDLDTNHAKIHNCNAIKADGFNTWYSEYAERSVLLTAALERYNDGRMKRYLCELFIKEDMSVLRMIMDQAQALQGTPKENGAGFRKIAGQILSGEPKENNL